MRNSEDWIRIYKEREALWIHDGNPRREHALLSSGLHSGGFFNSELVMDDPCLLDDACQALLERLLEEGFDINDVHRVVGPAMGAITIAHDLARRIGRRRGRPCLRGYTEKMEGEAPDKVMVFKRTSIRAGEMILPVEDVITTGGSISATITAIAVGCAWATPFVATLVNRSGRTKFGDQKIVALIDRPMPTWTPDMCPLCKEGSKAIKPKGSESWARLNAQY
ncbi:MAG: orotate phosphoribosyltransferase [Patescibacteria group bacterium]|jgi:orotate phosphoribosyltransferase|nr:orotate phosphoribosyltransferase [Patescibacteria group bacterium]